ncbi:hypothetical protein D3C72_835410 [compost metagenome]
MAEQANGAAYHSQAAAQLPGQAEFGGDGADRAGGIHGQLPRLAEGALGFQRNRLHQRHVRTGHAVFLGDGKQRDRARVDRLVHGVADARHRQALLPMLLHDARGGLRHVVLLCRAKGLHALQQAGGAFGRAREGRAHAAQACRDRSLHRLGRAQIGQAGHHGGGRHAMLHQHRQNGVEYGRLGIGWPPASDLEEGKIPEGDLADHVLAQVQATYRDAVGSAPAHVRAQLLFFHRYSC